MIAAAFDIVGLSSVLTFAFPFANEGGINGMAAEGFFGCVLCSVTSSKMLLDSGARFAAAPSPSPSSSSASSTVVCPVDRFTPVLNTSPGPRPPPNTLSGAAGTGFLFFGAGSIENSDEAPAPGSMRDFFAGGWPSKVSSSSMLAEIVGSPIAIFFGTFFFGAGKEKPEDDLAAAFGGGSERPGFFEAAAGVTAGGVGRGLAC